MRKRAEIIMMIMTFILGTASVLNAQLPDMIDNIEIVAIKGMHVESDTLHIETEIRNANDERVRFGDGHFTFYLRINTAEHEELGKDEKLGTGAISKAIILETAENGMNQVMFKISLGNQKQAISKLRRIVNAIGNPSASHPILYIHGEFRMGIQSDKGWSSAQTSIHWGFRPDLQERVLLNPLQQPPPREEIYKRTMAFSSNEKEIAISWDEYGRALTIVNFKKDSAKILPESYPILDTYGKLLNGKLSDGRYSDQAVTIEGHTCDLGTRDHNQKLSEDRAKSVRKYLTDHHGIRENRLTGVGYGEIYPRFSNGTEASRAKNRRVEFVLKK